MKWRKVGWFYRGQDGFCEVGNLVAKLKILTNFKMLTAVNHIYFLSLIVHVIFVEFDMNSLLLFTNLQVMNNFW